MGLTTVTMSNPGTCYGTVGRCYGTVGTVGAVPTVPTVPSVQTHDEAQTFLTGACYVATHTISL